MKHQQTILIPFGGPLDDISIAAAEHGKTGPRRPPMSAPPIRPSSQTSFRKAPVPVTAAAAPVRRSVYPPPGSAGPSFSRPAPLVRRLPVHKLSDEGEEDTDSESGSDVGSSGTDDVGEYAVVFMHASLTLRSVPPPPIPEGFGVDSADDDDTTDSDLDQYIGQGQPMGSGWAPPSDHRQSSTARPPLQRQAFDAAVPRGLSVRLGWL